MDDLMTWLQQEAKTLNRAGWSPGSPRETDLLAHWKANRPEMIARLMKLDPRAPKLLAFVLDRKRYATMMALLKEGMPPTDAEERATADWLLMEPEQEEPPLRPHVPTSILPILTG